MAGPALYTLRLWRGTTVRRLFTFIGTNFTGSTIVLFITPDGGSEIQITSGGTDPKLIIDAANGKITLYISVAVLNAYVWTHAAWRLQITDTGGDTRVRIQGETHLYPIA